MRKLLLILLMLFPISHGTILAQNSYVNNLDVAVKLSKETKQKIVLIFSADRCGHCKILKKDLPNLSGFDDKIICILDSDTEKKLGKEFNIKSLPTSIILTSDKKEISRKIGYDKKSYETWLIK